MVGTMEQSSDNQWEVGADAKKMKKKASKVQFEILFALSSPYTIGLFVMVSKDRWNTQIPAVLFLLDHIPSQIPPIRLPFFYV